MIHQDAPEELYSSLEGLDLSNLPEIYPKLLEFEKKGWITIHGKTERDPKDILACLQEHYDAKLIDISGDEPDA